MGGRGSLQSGASEDWGLVGAVSVLGPDNGESRMAGCGAQLLLLLLLLREGRREGSCVQACSPMGLGGRRESPGCRGGSASSAFPLFRSVCRSKTTKKLVLLVGLGFTSGPGLAPGMVTLLWG